jgi:hypothetical protein
MAHNAKVTKDTKDTKSKKGKKKGGCLRLFAKLFLITVLLGAGLTALVIHESRDNVEPPKPPTRSDIIGPGIDVTEEPSGGPAMDWPEGFSPEDIPEDVQSGTPTDGRMDY